MAESQFYNIEKNAKNETNVQNFHVFQICFCIIVTDILFSYMKCHDIPTNGSEHIANYYLFEKWSSARTTLSP